MSSRTGTIGKPKTGFDVDELIHNIIELLGYNNSNESIYNCKINSKNVFDLDKLKELVEFLRFGTLRCPFKRKIIIGGL